MVNNDLVISMTQKREALSRLYQILERADLDGSAYKATELVLSAFMWLGKAKKSLGVPNPYPNSMKAGNQTIEPAVDRWEGDVDKQFEIILNMVKEEDRQKPSAIEIAIIKQIRQELEGVCGQIRSTLMMNTNDPLFTDCIRYSWFQAEEAKHWLGVGLGEIRDRIARGGSDKVKELTPGTGGPLVIIVDDPAATTLDCIKELYLKGIKSDKVSNKLVDCLEYIKVGRPKPAQDQVDFMLSQLRELNVSLPVPVADLRFDEDLGEKFLEQCYDYLMGQPSWKPLIAQPNTNATGSEQAQTPGA